MLFWVIFRWNPLVPTRRDRLFISQAAQGNSITEVADWFIQTYGDKYRQLLCVVEGSQKCAQSVAEVLASDLQATSVEHVVLSVFRTAGGKLISLGRLPDSDLD